MMVRLEDARRRGACDAPLFFKAQVGQYMGMAYLMRKSDQIFLCFGRNSANTLKKDETGRMHSSLLHQVEQTSKPRGARLMMPALLSPQQSCFVVLQSEHR